MPINSPGGCVPPALIADVGGHPKERNGRFAQLDAGQ